MKDKTKTFFTNALLNWYDSASRPLPWKGQDDPYLIWLSEIILQQTRVAQGLPYFQKFIEAYPTVHDLAAAPDDEVMKNWEGLGYYARARNMLAAARYISTALNGQFPNTYDGILALKGVGPYTAAAIGSFAYGLPVAVLDGNVFRVLSRFFGIDTPIDSTAGKKLFAALAQELLPAAQSAVYNQAIMDMGATVCTPRSPSCSSCPLQEECLAFKGQLQADLPVKSKKLKKRDRYFYYLLLNQPNGELIVRLRQEKDIWQGLYDFPLLETEKLLAGPEALGTALEQGDFPQRGYTILRVSPPRKQTLSHQHIHAVFIEIKHPEIPVSALPEAWISVDRTSLTSLAFPRVVDWYLTDNSLYLNLF